MFPLKTLLLASLIAPTIAFKLTRTAPDSSTYVSFLIVFVSIAFINLLIFVVVTLIMNQKRRNLVRTVGDQLKYQLLNFDGEIEKEWKQVPEVKKLKPAESPKSKKKGLFALKREAEKEKKTGGKSEKSARH